MHNLYDQLYSWLLITAHALTVAWPQILHDASPPASGLVLQLSRQPCTKLKSLAECVWFDHGSTIQRMVAEVFPR